MSVPRLAAGTSSALAGHGWVLSQERPGRTETTLRLREHLAGIDVELHAQRVSIAHVDSAELDFEETKSCRAIHRTSNRRVFNVTSDVQTNHQRSAAGG